MGVGPTVGDLGIADSEEWVAVVKLLSLVRHDLHTTLFLFVFYSYLYAFVFIGQEWVAVVRLVRLDLPTTCLTTSRCRQESPTCN